MSGSLEVLSTESNYFCFLFFPKKNDTDLYHVVLVIIYCDCLLSCDCLLFHGAKFLLREQKLSEQHVIGLMIQQHL
jgi:hypothetical protein